MTADQGNSGSGLRGFGFQTYADDTPRDDEKPTAAEADYGREPGEAPAYGAYEPEPDPEPEQQSRRTRRWVAPGAVAALGVVLAMGAGIYMGRDDTESPIAAPSAVTAEPQMSVEVASVAETLTPPPPAPAQTEKLEVLPPPEARAAPARAALAPLFPLPAPRSRPAEVVQPPAPAPELPPARAREFALAPTPRDAVAVAPSPQASFDCRDAPTLATSMVCADRGLATLDRRMKQAYAVALDAGAAEDLLSADQEDWLAVREEAAHVSRQAVVDIYRQRIGELRRAGRD